MSRKYFNYFKLMAVAAAIFGAHCPTAKSADLGLIPRGGAISGSCSEVVLTCQNGREYPICPIAVSVAGEIVTATIHLAPRQATYVRLIPMGVGYRYAGKGIWLDGLRENAILNFHKNREIACTVVGS
jgi:hypothetical protein